MDVAIFCFESLFTTGTFSQHFPSLIFKTSRMFEPETRPAISNMSCLSQEDVTIRQFRAKRAYPSAKKACDPFSWPRIQLPLLHKEQKGGRTDPEVKVINSKTRTCRSMQNRTSVARKQLCHAFKHLYVANFEFF